MSKNVPTIYDVAALSGVSISTVSRVLNTPERVNEETRSNVLSAIERLGFVPKADARARAMRENRRIAVISPYLTAPAFVQRLRGVIASLQDTQYQLVIYTVASNEALNSYLETLPLTHYLDGLIIFSLQFDDRFAQRLVDYGLETVLVEYPHQVLSSVEIDDVYGGRIAAEYLMGKGHRKLGFAGDTEVPEFGIHPITLRLAGFRQTLTEAGISLSDEAILLTPYDVEATYQRALVFLRQSDRPSAIFAATDLQAIGLMKAARELGLSVPQDLALVGFDDLDLADYVGLTTIRQHLDESGRIAVELLRSRIADPGRPIQHVQLPLTLVERETA